MTTETPTLHSELKARGLGHRSTLATINSGKREIYQTDTGKIIGQFDAHEAWEHVVNTVPRR